MFPYQKSSHFLPKEHHPVRTFPKEPHLCLLDFSWCPTSNQQDSNLTASCILLAYPKILKRSLSFSDFHNFRNLQLPIFSTCFLWLISSPSLFATIKVDLFCQPFSFNIKDLANLISLKAVGVQPEVKQILSARTGSTSREKMIFLSPALSLSCRLNCSSLGGLQWHTSLTAAAESWGSLVKWPTRWSWITSF